MDFFSHCFTAGKEKAASFYGPKIMPLLLLLQEKKA
jgi:hypothetical protein